MSSQELEGTEVGCMKTIVLFVVELLLVGVLLSLGTITQGPDDYTIENVAVTIIGAAAVLLAMVWVFSALATGHEKGNEGDE